MFKIAFNKQIQVDTEKHCLFKRWTESNQMLYPVPSLMLQQHFLFLFGNIRLTVPGLRMLTKSSLNDMHVIIINVTLV